MYCWTGALLLMAYAVLAPHVRAQEEETQTMVQPRRLVDMHTAGVLPKASLDFETRIYPSRHEDVDGGGTTFSISVGITDRFMFGGGYGFDGLVGHGPVRGNPWPGLCIKYRLIEENYFFPAIAIGYDWQGYGGIEKCFY